MARASADKGRGVGSRIGRPLKVVVGVLLVLLVLIILNAFALENETDSASLNVPGAELVNTTSGQIQVLDTGETASPSLPIVLIHGSAGAINWWDDLIPLLKPEHRVIAIDMLGYGGSEKPNSDYSVETQANLIAQVLAKLQVPESILVGHSLGGKVVTSVAEQSPDLVAGLVVIDTAPDNSFGGLSGGAKATRTPLLGPALWRIAPDFMIRSNVSQGFAPDYDVPDKYVEDVREMTYPAYKDSASMSEDYTAARSLPDRLTEIAKPLLVIFGEQDQIYDARTALSAYAAIPDTETLLIPASGHSPQVEAPQRTAAAIDGFANRLEAEQKAEAVAELRRARAKARAEAKRKAKARRQARAKAKRNAGNQGRQKQGRQKQGRQKQGRQKQGRQAQ